MLRTLPSQSVIVKPLSSVKHFGLLAMLLAGALSAETTWAAPIYWIDDGGNYNGDFEDTNHWSATQGGAGGEPVPDSSDIAMFDNNQASSYAVDLNSSLAVGGVQVDTDNVTLDVGTSTMTLGAGLFRVGGANETGVLTINSSAGSGQGIVINGAASIVEVGVGTNANGTLIIDGGARYQRTGGGSPVIGSGTGAQAIVQIIDGTGNFSGSGTSFGGGGDAVVDITVESAGTMITNGHMNIAGGGAPDVTIDINGGTWNHTHGSRSVSFGSEASGQGAATIDLTIRNGATATSSSNYQQSDGRPERSLGKDISVTVTGSGSSMRSVSHYIGGGPTTAVESTHTTTVADSAILGVSQTLKVWGAADSNGTPDGIFGDDGVLTLDNGIVEIDGTDGSPGNMDVEGVLRGVGTVRRRAGSGSDLVSVDVSGNLRPGDVTSLASTGVLTFEDATLDMSGTLDLDIAGDSDFDQIHATGVGSSIDLTGNLDIEFLGGYKPAVNQVFNLLFAENLTYSGTSNLDLNPQLYSIQVLPNYIGSTDVLQLSIIPIPEPGTLSLMSFAGLLLLRKRRRRSQR